MSDMVYPFGIYGKGMHDAVMRELEVGYRVVVAQDDEDCGFGPLFDRLVEEDIALHPENWGIAKEDRCDDEPF